MEKSLSEEFHPHRERRFDLKALLIRYIFSAWYLYLLTLGLAIVFAYYYNWYTTPVYSARTTLLIKENKRPAGADLLAELDEYYNLGGLENEIGVLSSRALITKTLRELNFDVSYILRGNIKTTELYKNSPIKISYENATYLTYRTPIYLTVTDATNYILRFKHPIQNETLTYKGTFNEGVNTPIGRFTVNKNDNFQDANFDDPHYEKRNFILRIHTIDQLADVYQKRLRIQPLNKKSTILEIVMTDPVPDKAADFLNKLTEVYLQYTIEVKNVMTSNTLKFIDDQLALLAQQVDTSERALEEFKAEQKIADLSSEAQSVMNAVRFYENKITEIDLQLSFLNYLENYVKEGKNLRELSPASIGINDVLLVKFIQQLAELTAYRREQIQTTTEDNPLIRNLDIQIQNTKTNLLENIKSIRDGLRASRNEAMTKLGAIENKIKNIPSIERQLFGIQRESQIKQSLYTYLLQKKAETSILLASTISDNRIIDMARVSSRPIKPKKSQTYTLAILAALILPAGFFYLRDVLNDSIKDRFMLENITSLPILGIVGVSKSDETMVVHYKPESQIAEAFRGIRTNLQFFCPEKSSKVVLITSAISAEGKSFCAANLAAIIAQAGKKVLLIQGDMRKPKKDNEFKLKNDIGLSNYLAGKATLDEIIQPFESLPQLHIILSGPKPPNPAELIGTQYMTQLIEQARHIYEFVIIDSPPIGVVTDSLLFSSLADIVVNIVRQHVTRKLHIELMNNPLIKNKLNNPCIILNAVHTGGIGYGYVYGYEYGYGYGYYEEDKKSDGMFKRILKKTNLIEEKA